MNVFYRVSPFLSMHQNPLGSDKIAIVHECWQSFCLANDIDADITIISNLPDNEHFRFADYPVITAPVGNVETFHAQLDQACKLPDETKVLFAEDDYLWVPNSLSIISEALNKLEIVFPYDHPGHYTEGRFRDELKRMVLINNQTYREAPSNTLTFATKASIIKRHIDLIKSFQLRDHELFQSLSVSKWCAVPSLATHLVEGLLAPNRKWL